MEMSNDTAFGRSNSGGAPLRPKSTGFMQNMVNGITRLEQRATGNRRKKFEAKQLPPGKDIFNGYEFPQAPTAATKTAGRKPYNWTPKRSRELIKLIIHTDLKFDDISTAMKDENGQGPSETTCRNHWHEIFGYSPDMARLKYGQGRERRLREHMEAFDAHRKKMKTLEASTVAAEMRNDGFRASRSSKSTLERSRTSSMYADSGIQVDDDGTNTKLSSDEHIDDSYDPYAAPDFIVTPSDPSQSVSNSVPAFEGYGLRAGLSTVQEDTEAPEHLNRPLSPNPAPSEISPEDVQGTPQDRRASKLPGPRTIDQIEDKEDLPSGFISWFRKISLGSTTDSRHPSTASYASRTSLRFSHSVRHSVATSFTMGFHHDRVPKDAICRYLGSNSAIVEPSVGYVEELIQRGADVNAQNARGETPLHFAVGRGAIVICTILLQHGAKADIKSFSGEDIWTFGRRISKDTLNPNATYDKTEQLLRTMVAARIEFLRATIKFNPDMIVEEPERAKRRRGSEQNNAWSRSGASGSSTRKKSKMHSSVSPKPVASPLSSMTTPTASQPTPTPTTLSRENTESSNEATPEPPVAAQNHQWQYQMPTEQQQHIPPYAGQVNDPSYFPDPTTMPIYDDQNQFTQSFPTENIDAHYADMPPNFFDNAGLVADQSFDPIGLTPPAFQDDTATIHPVQNMGYMQEHFSPDQTYSQPSPPCPDGTVSPSQLSMGASPGRLSMGASPGQLSMGASPSHLSVSGSPGQYYSDHFSHSERGNSDASTVDPVVVPTYTLGMEQTMQGAACNGQTFAFPPMGQFSTPEQLWAAYQSQNWGHGGGGYSQ